MSNQFKSKKLKQIINFLNKDWHCRDSGNLSLYGLHNKMVAEF